MLKKKLLMLATISALLTTTTFGAGTQKCVGGVCFINLDKLEPVKAFEKKKEALMVWNENTDNSMTIILDGEMITIFPKSTYMMNEKEKIAYYNEEELLIVKSADSIEDRILEKADLPLSEYFCEKDTKPLYNTEDDTFQCV